MAINTSFWKKKKVFVTGHTGFKGGWLSLWLQSLGAEVYGYSLEPDLPENFFEISEVGSGMETTFGDIRNYNMLSEAFVKFNPEIVFHLAAQPLVRYSYENPIDTYSTNVMGTVNLLEICSKIESVRSIVNITTDKCYENIETTRSYLENDPMGGYDPYSSSKGCAELATASFRESFFNTDMYEEHNVGLASVRAGNVIGGGDWAKDRLIPDIFRSINNNKKTLKIRNPNSTRPWQHVLEPLAGYLTLAEKLYVDGANFSEAWNFGPEDDEVYSVISIVKKLNSLLADKIKWDEFEGNKLHEAKLLSLNIDKAKKKLNWRPKLSIDESLKLIVHWNDEYIKKTNMKIFSTSQINSYSDIISN